MGTFIVIVSSLAIGVVLPTAEPGYKIHKIQENSVTLLAFDKNLDKAESYAQVFCHKKEKKHKLNIDQSR